MSEEVKKEVESTVQESKGFSIASMVLGIISLVLFCLWYISVPCAIIAIIFAIVGMKKGGKGMAITGLVLGIISISIYGIFFLFGAALGLTGGLISQGIMSGLL